MAWIVRARGGRSAYAWDHTITTDERMSKMTDTDRDRLEGKFEKGKGSVKEGVGDLRNDEDQQAEGKADQAKGEGKDKLGEAKKKVSEGIDKLTGDN
jgi:uncharacterized protein YjbJ (UPF0337 family)